MFDWITKDNADVVVAWATVVGAAIALIAAFAAVRQLSMIQRDSRERTRPYVQLDVVPGLQGAGSWDLIIENTGASTALDVVADAGTIEPLGKDDHIAPVIGAYLLAPKTLVPGARRRVMWGYDRSDLSYRAGVLEPREVTVKYFDERQARRRFLRKRHYTNTFTVGEEMRGAVTPIPFEGPVPTGKDMLVHINRALRTLNTHVGELRR